MITQISDERIVALRRDLAAADYTVTALTRAWGPVAEAALHRNETVPAIRALDGRDQSPLDTLARLFILGQSVELDAARAAFPVADVRRLIDDGILASIDDPEHPRRVMARIDLRPYSFVDQWGAGSWWIASDLGELATGRELDEDHVLGIGGATTTLIGLMLPRRVDVALDLGTGCGVVAMHASRVARRVIATDVSERAIRFASFNVALNEISNVEFRRGDLYEPVAGERFDLIVSNPPFVITPRRDDVPAYEYRDGGLVGDAIVERVVTGASERLAAGGVLQMLGNWEYRDSRAGMERVAEWAAALDHWIIERELQDPAEYAATWIRDGGTRQGSPAYTQLYRAWLDDFTAREVRQIGLGYILLRRAADDHPRLRRTERLHSPIAGAGAGAGLGAHLERVLAGWDALPATENSPALLDQRFRVSADATEERHYWPGAEDPTVIRLQQGAGFGRSLPLDTALAAFIGACDGELTAGVIIAAIAQLLAVDAAALADEIVPRLAELVLDGFLAPADLDADR